MHMFHHTRRGNTQKNEQVVICPPCGEQSLAPEGFYPGGLQGRKGVIHKDCHSRGFLSGISTLFVYRSGVNLTQVASKLWNMCHKAGNLFGSHPIYKEVLNKSSFKAPLRFGFTPCRHPELDSGSRRFVKGFTLIELLVVVLIIGILAAVAVPQYQKAVMKSRGAEALNAIKALEKGVAAYYLEHGTYEGISNDTLNIQLPELKYFSYVVENTPTHIFSGGKVEGVAGPYGVENYGSIFSLYLKADSGGNSCYLLLYWKGGRTNGAQVKYNLQDCEKYFNLVCREYRDELFPGGPIVVKNDCYVR